MKSVVTIGLLAATGIFSNVHATESSEAGVYIGLGAGKSTLSSKYVEDSSDPAFSVNAGYKFNSTLAVEIFARSMSFRLGQNLPAILAGDDSYYPDNHYGTALIASVPLAKDVNLYGRAGIGRTKMESSFAAKPSYNKTEASYGVGARYAFSPLFSMNLEATRFAKSEVNTFLLGVEWTF